MKWIRLLSAACLAAAISTATAQTAPTLQRAPEHASWTITFKYHTPAAAQQRKEDPDPVQSLTVTKSGKTYHEQIVHASGETEEKWAFEDALLQIVKGGGVIVAEVPKEKSSPEFSHYESADFGGLEWIAPAHFRGAQNYQGKAAYLFEMAKGQGKATLVLSAETQWPLVYSDDQMVCSYTYNPPPQALTPPGKIVETLRKHRAGMERLKFHPSAP
jgi:hypothetical protein